MNLNLFQIMKIIFAATILFATFARADVTTNSISTSTNVMSQIKLAHPNVTIFQVLPSVTDPEIKTFNYPSSVFINREIVVEHKEDLAQDRHELLFWITGTGGKTIGPVAFSCLAADLGYHVINLNYVDDIPASICRNDNDPNGFEEFRMAIIRGGHSKHITVERAESMENRLIKLLQHLQKLRPRENWGQFLNDDGTIKWESIAVSGQSQGGGHATLIAIKHKVARVICTGSPKDFYQKRNVPAAYYKEESATPKNRFFAFNHLQDYTGSTSPEQLLKNCKALGLYAFGAPVNVDAEGYPFHHSRILMTGFPVVEVTGPQSEGSLTAHFSMLNNKYADRWKQVWTYLLTEPPQ
jgi:hypothetical protein